MEKSITAMEYDMKKGKRKVTILVAVLFMLLLILAVTYGMFANELNVIETIKCLDKDKKLYSMEYKGNYGLSEMLARGGVVSDKAVEAFASGYISKGFYHSKIETSDTACSVISAKTPEGDYIYGRNFDWNVHSTMILRLNPKEGYSSISTVNLDNLGYDLDYQPDSFINSWLALAAPFVPLDGMNEKGLCVSDLQVNTTNNTTNQDNGLTDITTTVGIRMILDKCATVKEAVELLRQYDMHSSAGIMHHLSVSDALGNAVVVEYVDNEMVVTDAKVLTNFWMYDGNPEKYREDTSYLRYRKLEKLYNASNGLLSEENIKEGLMSVVQSGKWNTEWSVVYNQSKLTSVLYYKSDFEKPYYFNIK